MTENNEALQRAARLAREQVDKTAVESIQRIKQKNIQRNQERYGCPDCDLAKCYITCPRYLTNCEPEELFRWWGRTSPPDGKQKEYIQPMPAPPAKRGGGSKSKRKKDRKLQKDAKRVI